MGMTGWVRAAVVTSMAASAALAAEAPRTGVVVVGPDSASVAAAQKSIETKLATAPSTVRGVELLALMAAPTAATANAWASDPAARSAFEAALGDAKKSYFSDLMPQATAKLDEAAAIIDRAIDVPGTIRVKVPLWRAAVALRQNQKDTAASEVNVALLLVPNLEAEPNSPPPVVQLLAEVRAKNAKPVKVQVAGLPANAVVKIDDVVLAPNAMAVLPGSHVIDVIAPGFRPFNQSFDAAKSDVTISAVLVPAMSAAWERLFEGIVARGSVTDTDRKAIEPIAVREKLDALVIAHVKPGEIAGVVWRRSDATSEAGSGADAAAFAAWAAPLLAVKGVAIIPTATPRPVETPAPTPTPASVVVAVATPAPTPRPSSGGRAFGAIAEAGVVFARWDRTVEPKSGAGYEVPGLTGGGPRLRVLAGRRTGIAGMLDVTYVSFGNMAVTDPDDDGKRVTVPGGTLMQARLGAGWRIVLGDGERPLTLLPSVGGFYESHAAHDLEDEGVFPSHTRTGADVRLLATIPLGPAGLLVEAGVSPVSTWADDPDGTLGKDPAPGASPSLRIGIDFPVGPRGRIGIDAAGESRPVTYSGAGSSPGLNPVDAKRSEMLTTVGASFRYRF